ncbi:MAG: 8-oxo-dGTP diphosphatase [Roseburia sp.]|uniref:NUDIX hydrolase n=1 Tax=Roseburia sp. 831b TaxID=1261635 RepID=UPI0009533218|nr:8-oxo-dGTP diphosphatase [Roseburia sp. 831b]MCI5918182.1 8-oxo-dGTP diphosphatase [Roseburia sp.]MDD6215816.1 8-oxo-dGTP diphosphatase [Roseburia sp.]MDY5883976.1 8-oxo-dGTP diphosphatase [Roseburia sp.]WVK72406.1 8-oxo-dGTP diphosphatase [Roseburia sp. 831b]
MKMTTLCYIEQDGKFLMLHRNKEKEDPNAGKWIGVGGHMEQGESPEECLLREVTEETGLHLTNYQFRGLVTFISDETEREEMCLFTANEFEGELHECDEGELAWIPKENVQELPTWEGDAVFLKLILEEESRFFTLKLVYQGEKLVEQQVHFYGASQTNG